MLRRGCTDYFNSAVMKYMAGLASAPTFGGGNLVYVGLSTTIPDQAGNNITEPSGGAYARQPLVTAVSGNQFMSLANGSPAGLYATSAGVLFPAPTVSWSTNPIQAVTLWDALTNGNLLCWDAGIAPFSAIVGQPAPWFPPGSIRVGINTGWGRRGMIAEAVADAIMALIFQSTAFSATASYVALCSSVPLPSDTSIAGTEITTVGTNGYARTSIGTLAEIKKGRLGNSAVVQPPVPTGAWGNAVAWALMTASSAGSPWFAGLLNPPRTIDQYRMCPPFLINQLQLGLGQ